MTTEKTDFQEWQRDDTFEKLCKVDGYAQIVNVNKKKTFKCITA